VISKPPENFREEFGQKHGFAKSSIIDLNAYSGKIIKLLNRSKLLAGESKIIALHVYKEALLINTIMKTGIHVYIPVELLTVNLITAVKTVLNNEKYFPHVDGNIWHKSICN